MHDREGRRHPAAAAQTLPRLLVVTYYAPGGRHGGAVCLQNLLDGYPRENLCWIHHDVPVTDPASSWSAVRQWSIPLLRRPNRWGLSALKEYGNWTWHAPRVAAEAASLARDAGVEAVLGIGPGLSVWTSHLIAERLDVPLHLWIHDDPAAYAEYRWHPRFVVNRVRRCFQRAYEAASARYAISEPMRDSYRQQTGRDALLLPPSLGARPVLGLRPRRGGRLRIGFAGSIAGEDVWTTFLLALERLFGTSGSDAQPEIVVFSEPDGLPVPPAVRNRNWVRIRGWQPPDVVDRELAETDYVYVPLWFEPARRPHVRTSFSTKFVSYLRLGVPILCHMPADAAVAEFVGRHPVGPILDTMDVEELSRRLRAAFEAEDWHSRYAAARAAALAGFDQCALTRRFHESLFATTGRGGNHVCAGEPATEDAITATCLSC